MQNRKHTEIAGKIMVTGCARVAARARRSWCWAGLVGVRRVVPGHEALDDVRLAHCQGQPCVCVCVFF